MRYASISFGKNVRRRLLIALPCVLLVVFTCVYWSRTGGCALCGGLSFSDAPVYESDPPLPEEQTAPNEEGETPSEEQLSSADVVSPSAGGIDEQLDGDEPAVPAYIGTDRLSVSGEPAKPLGSAQISSLFGYRTNPVTGEHSFHSGLDLAAPAGSEIYAVLAGEVSAAKYDRGYGYYVVVDHGDGLQTLYAHCSKLLVKKGDSVERGGLIALVGSTGSSTGPHLHIEFRKDGKRYDPQTLIGEMYS